MKREYVGEPVQMTLDLVTSTDISCSGANDGHGSLAPKIQEMASLVRFVGIEATGRAARYSVWRR